HSPSPPSAVSRSLITATSTTAIYTLSLHDALPISELPDDTDEPFVQEVNVALFPVLVVNLHGNVPERTLITIARDLRDTLEGLRSEEHTSELQSRENLVCRLLLEKKKKT